MTGFNPFSLEGKTILVTGASSGIGRGIAVTCSEMGATVIINGRNKERLQETLSLMEGEGNVVARFEPTVDMDEVKAAVQAIL